MYLISGGQVSLRKDLSDLSSRRACLKFFFEEHKIHKCTPQFYFLN